MRISIRTKLILLLFVFISLSIVIISNQAYKIAFKDMSNNAKFNTRLYAKDISNLIEVRLDSIKEKTLFSLLNEDLKASGSSIIFGRSPEILAVARYHLVDAKSVPERKSLLINPKYEASGLIKIDSLSGLDRAVDFTQVIKNNEFLAVGKLLDYNSDVIVYAFPAKVTGTEGIQIFTAVLIPDMIVAAIRPEGSKYVNYMVNDRGKILAHPNPGEVNKKISKLALFDDFFDNDAQREKTVEYMDENGQKVVGSIFKIKRSNIGIVSKILASDAYNEAEKLRIILIATSIVVFIISLVVALFFAKTMIDPLMDLSKITGEIARGNFLVNINVKSKDEIGNLASSFKKMGKELYDRDQELQNTQAALVQSAKMSALGQIGAGIAHEVKNPLTGILGHAQLAREKIMNHADPEEINKNLEIIEKETKRCKDIIENLMKFSRQEKAIMSENDIEKIVANSIALIEHQLSINGVKVVQELAHNVPKVIINANQVEQVFVNLMINAMHAMEGKDKKILTVRLNPGTSGFAKVEIEDTGMGMTDEVKKKIFEPFFTTKPSGKGTGLGLSVSYGIIKSHKGTLELKSTQGVGTNFIIELPYVSTYPELAVESAKISQTDQKEAAVKEVLIGKDLSKPAAPAATVVAAEQTSAPAQATAKAEEFNIPPVPSSLGEGLLMDEITASGVSKPAKPKEPVKRTVIVKSEPKPETKPETKKELDKKKLVGNFEVKRPSRRS